MLSQNSRVRVLLPAAGKRVYSLWTHHIRVSDPDNYIDAVFNYGAFDFNTPNFVPVCKGDLELLLWHTIIATLSIRVHETICV
jgi:hypothetical protein